MLGIVAVDVLYDDILNLANLGEVGLVVTASWFTLLVIHLECFGSFENAHPVIKPLLVQSHCGSLSRVDTLGWFEFFKLRFYVTNIYFLDAKDWYCRLE